MSVDVYLFRSQDSQYEKRGKGDIQSPVEGKSQIKGEGWQEGGDSEDINLGKYGK